MAGLDAQVRRALASDSRVRLLRALEVAGRPLHVRELVEHVQLHLSTVRGHLGVLIDAGLVESETEARTSPGRPRVLYRLGSQHQAAREHPGPPSTHGADYRLLAEVLVGHLAGTSPDPAEQARAVGRAWGQYLMERPPPFEEPTPDEARAKVLALFAKLGFAPELSEDANRILCRRCPFLDVARRYPDVVCSMHLGLLQGALDTLGDALTSDQLEPLVEPELCVAHLDGTSA